MSNLRKRIKERVDRVREHNPDSNVLKIWFLIFIELGLAFQRLLMAKYYLQRCAKVGVFVSVNGKPKIKNQGQIYLGDEVRIWSNVYQAKIFVERGAVLRVGDNTRLNGCHISASYMITIGNNVRIAPEVLIIDSDYHSVQDHFAVGKKCPIVIEDDVWLASRSMILKGVRVGKGAVVAAGAVVTKDVPPYSVVAGVPAKVIQYLKNPEEQNITIEINTDF
jgi:acetyltransferase-like isoleucine patch superfamily enzyme